jgi:hypothetical protein
MVLVAGKTSGTWRRKVAERSGMKVAAAAAAGTTERERSAR